MSAIKKNSEAPSSNSTHVFRQAAGLMFRQVRHSNETVGLTIELDGVSCEVINWSRLGIGFKTPANLKLEIGSILENCKILLEGQPIYNGGILVRALHSSDQSGHAYGGTFKSSLFMVEGIHAAQIASSTNSKIKNSLKEIRSINPKVIVALTEMQIALEHLKDACEEAETRLATMIFDQRVEFEKIFLEKTANDFREVMTEINKEVGDAVDVENLNLGGIYHFLFERLTYLRYFAQADLIRRAKEKPRGYAGDFEMMNQMYRNGFEGAGLFGKVLHHYVANEDSSRSVKFRKPYFLGFYDKLKAREETSSVLSIACGPAVEVQDIVKTWSNADLNKLQITLFDLDKFALEHAQNKIYENAIDAEKIPNIRFVNASVKSFLTSNLEVNGSYDLIYSGGLFDYIDQPTSKALIHKFYEILRPGGTMVIGNFTKANGSKAFCHLVTDWHLIHKSEEEILDWATGIKGATAHLEFDPMRINAFLVVKKDGPAKVGLLT